MGIDFGQEAPVANTRKASWELVIADMESRDNFGRKKYGTPLQPLNGRDSLKDAYEELLDGAVYLRNMIEERELKKNEASRLVDSMVTGACDPASERFRILREVRSRLYEAGL